MHSNSKMQPISRVWLTPRRNNRLRPHRRPHPQRRRPRQRPPRLT